MRIVLVADDRILRDGLRALLGQNATTEVTGEANCSPEAAERVSELEPDVVIADIGSWTSGSVEMVRRIARAHPPVRIVVLSPIRNQAFVAAVFRAGTHGYVVKRNGFDELLRAIDAVCSGSTYLCPRVRELILPGYAQSHGAARKPSEAGLTEREAAVLELLAEGQTSKEVALMLNVSSKTIDACRRQLMKKLEVNSVAGLVKRALAMGMTTLAS